MPAGHGISSAGDIEGCRVVLADTTRSSTTAAAQPDLTVPLGLGVYVYNYYLVLQSAATTTGHKFNVNFTGTKGILANNLRWLAGVALNADDVPNQAFVTAGGGVISGYSARGAATTGTMVTTDVDVINADVLYILEGIVSVTAIGSLELYWAPEAAANATMKAGSSLLIWKTG